MSKVYLFTSSFTCSYVYMDSPCTVPTSTRKLCAGKVPCMHYNMHTRYSGRFRNSEGGSATGTQSTPENVWAAMPTFGHVKVRTEYLEAPLGLVKRLEISKELIRECVTVAGCCCCMPLLRNNLMDSCSYVHKNTLLAATPLNPPLR